MEMEMEGACWPTAATATATSSTCTSTSTSSEEMKRKSTSSSSASGKARVYRGVRMRKWGKWVAEIREPRKRTRIWLGSYSTPVAAARAYDTAVFLLRGRSARLNFPEEISAVETELAAAAADSDCLSSASIRKKATEVGARIDALQMGLVMSSSNQKQKQQQQQRPDLNQHPSPDSSDDE